MTGGSATHAGIGFQDEVAAFLAVHILAQSPIEILGLPMGVTPTGISLETTAPVDDILVSTSVGGRCFFNAKLTVTNSSNPDSPLGSALDQFVRLWITFRDGGSSQDQQYRLNCEQDRMVLITGPHRSGTFMRSFSKILERIRDRGSSVPVEEIATNQIERSVSKTVLGQIRAAARRHTGQEFPDLETTEFLSMVRAAQLDFDGMDKTNSLALLRNSVVESLAEAQGAWPLIVAKCQSMGELGSGVDESGLRRHLKDQGVRLSDALDIAADVRRLRKSTSEELASLTHLARLTVPTAVGPDTIEIERDVTRVLTEEAPINSMLITGEPGSGKSGAIHAAAQQLVSDNCPVVVIAVDRHPAACLDDLRRSLGLEEGLVDVLRDWPGGRRGVLFIDALDATRGGPSDGVFQDLIRRVSQEVPNWSVVASIRVFDLRFGIWPRNLFRGSPVDKNYSDSEFDQIQHLSIPRLTDNELGQIWVRSSTMRKAYCDGKAALRQLLRSPFNQFLLAEVLANGPRDLTQIKTQLELLDLYWLHRVGGTDQQNFAREEVLRTALDEMLEQHQLSASTGNVPGKLSGDLNRLLSEGVLRPSSRDRTQPRRFSFAHHVLFDYAVATLILDGGRAHDLASRLAKSDVDALLIAPSANMAFQMLWDEGQNGHKEFWAKALDLAGTEGSGAFCRMLPARVVAAATESLEDFEPILDCLTKTDHHVRQAALFLAQHCIGALTSGVLPSGSNSTHRGPWPSIAEALTVAAVEDAKWMVRPMISRWVETPASLNAGEKRCIGSAARRILDHSSGEAYDASIVRFAIQAIARTFESAPRESLQSLELVLSPGRVSKHGHNELYWLARESKHLLRHVPTTSCLVGDIYRAAYCTPLPSSDEETSISESRILGLTSNKLQDFLGSRYQLFKSFGSFFRASPESATKVLVDLIEHVLGADLDPGDFVEEFVVLGERARYLCDRSYVRIWSSGDETEPPLHHFESELVALVDAERIADLEKVLRVVIRRNRLAGMWAVVLRAAARRPEVLGKRLVDLVTTKPILEGLDTRKDAGDLIAALHPLLDVASREALEQAVLGVGKAARQILLGCFQADNMISVEARDQMKEVEARGEMLPNRPPFEVRTGFVSRGDDWWLQEAGVDLENEENASLNRAISVVESVGRRDEDRKGRLGRIQKEWSYVLELRRVLESCRGAPAALLMSGWHALANVASTVTGAAETCDDLDQFPGLVEIIHGALAPDFWPEAVSHAESEWEFARSPSWGSPAPRVEAAKSVMGLCRVVPDLEPSLAELVESLARDPSPAVRLQVLGYVRLLLQADRPQMHRLIEIGFSEETNDGVLSPFLEAIQPALPDRPAWFVDRLLELEDRSIAFRTEDSSDRCLEHAVSLLIRLWLVFDQSDAEFQVRKWISEPISYSAQTRHALTALRGAIIQGSPKDPDENNERVRAGAVEFFQCVTQRLVAILSSLPKEPDRIEPDQAATGRSALEILDNVAAEIYFGSGAHDDQERRSDDSGHDRTTELVRARFLSEMAPTLGTLAAVPHPSVTHRLLETLEPFIGVDPKQVFQMVTDALLQGGRTGEYQIEGLGADLVVRIFQRYLADHRGILISEPELRHRLVKALDAFVEVGWPNALEFVYDLPEKLR